MKISVITGSAHKNGTTVHLAEEFIKGATEAGHEVNRFDAAFKNVHPCIACERCHNTDKGCVFDDDMKEVNSALLGSDAVVFVTPIYYYAMNAQIRTVIDRFYANDSALHNNKKAALIVTMADNNYETARGAIESFNGMINFLGWKNAGMVIGVDCATVADLEKYDYLEQAYKLGKNI